MRPGASRWSRPLAAAVLAALLLPAAAAACAVCFGDPEDPMAKGMNNAILALLGVVALVQAGLVAMFVSFWVRIRRLRRRRERFHLVAGGTS